MLDSRCCSRQCYLRMASTGVTSAPSRSPHSLREVKSFHDSESFGAWRIEAAVLTTKCAEAALLDEEVEELGGEVGGALAQLLHL